MKILIEILRWFGAKIVLILVLMVSLTLLYKYQPELSEFLDPLPPDKWPPELIEQATRIDDQITEIEKQISVYEGLIKDREDNRPPAYKIFARREYDAQTRSLDYEGKQLRAIDEKKVKHNELADLFPIKNLIAAAEDRISQIERDIEDREKNRPPWHKFIERKKYDAQTQALEYGKKRINGQEDLAKLKEKLETIIPQIIPTFWDKFFKMLEEHKFHVAWIIIVIMFGPFFWKVLWYYGFARLAEKAKPIQLSTPHAPGQISFRAPEKRLVATVSAEHALFVRMRTVKQHDKQHIAKKMRLVWKWSAPFISYAAGLWELTEITAKAEGNSGEVLLISDTPGMRIVELTLENHPGFVVSSRYVVGISGGIDVKTQWCIHRLHSWLTGQFRYVIFTGSGRLYLQGHDGIDAMPARHDPIGIEKHLVIGFDARLAFSTSRTETFWPYLRGVTPLIEDQFAGDGYFLRQVSGHAEAVGFAEKRLEFLMSFISAIGKFFGF